MNEPPYYPEPELSQEEEWQETGDQGADPRLATTAQTSAETEEAEPECFPTSDPGDAERAVATALLFIRETFQSHELPLDDLEILKRQIGLVLQILVKTQALAEDAGRDAVGLLVEPWNEATLERRVRAWTRAVEPFVHECARLAARDDLAHETLSNIMVGAGLNEISDESLFSKGVLPFGPRLSAWLGKRVENPSSKRTFQRVAPLCRIARNRGSHSSLRLTPSYAEAATIVEGILSVMVWVVRAWEDEVWRGLLYDAATASIADEVKSTREPPKILATIHVRSVGEVAPAPSPRASKRNEHEIKLGSLISRVSGAKKVRSHLIIEGAPGSGKSFVRRSIVRSLRQTFSRLEPIPLYINAEYVRFSQATRVGRSNDSLFNLVNQVRPTWIESERELKSHLETGRFCIIIDELECVEDSRKREIVACVEREMHKKNGNVILLVLDQWECMLDPPRHTLIATISPPHPQCIQGYARHWSLEADVTKPRSLPLEKPFLLQAICERKPRNIFAHREEPIDAFLSYYFDPSEVGRWTPAESYDRPCRMILADLSCLALHLVAEAAEDNPSGIATNDDFGRRLRSAAREALDTRIAAILSAQIQDGPSEQFERCERLFYDTLVERIRDILLVSHPLLKGSSEGTCIRFVDPWLEDQVFPRSFAERWRRRVAASDEINVERLYSVLMQR